MISSLSRTTPVPVPEQGQLVEVRRRRYVVTEVLGSALPSSPYNPTAGSQNLVTLSSVEDDALGEELQVIWEIEPGTHTIHKNALPQPIGFDPPERLDTFLNAVRWGAASSADVKAIQSPFRSGIDVENYQLDPVARAIQMPRVNLLIADDVGLGKTIEAGLVAQELVIRHRTRKILIVCPAALQVQWHDQMRDKFGLDFRIVDSKLFKELRRSRGLHVNPWSHYPRLITSIDFLKRERPMRLFMETLPTDGESTYPRKYDLLILDEAHNVAPSGRGKYATDSQRTRTIRRLAPHFEHRLFLSATPHNGYQESFSSLLELLDNQRFARGVNPDPNQLRSIMIRRMKSEIRDDEGELRFPRRVLHPLTVEYSEDERRLHHLLREYTRLRTEHVRDDEIERYATEFVLKLLKKRLFSSPGAFQSTLTQHIHSQEEGKKRQTVTRKPAMGLLRSQLEQVEEESDDDEELEEARGTAIETATPLFRQPDQQENQLLKEMQAQVENLAARPDTKARKLINWLRQTLKPGGKWNNERVIIFTEYRATQKWLYELLAHQGFAEQDRDGEYRLQTLYGGMSTEDREAIKAAFQANPEDSAVRILLATDAASEGIDLQNYCSRLIHYEIPWNPNRLEQRNGRVDRHGQKAGQVDIYHFVGSTYKEGHDDELPVGDLDADLEFLFRAVQKVNQIREDLGSVGPVIADQVEEAMLGKRRRLDTSKVEDKNRAAKRILTFERNLKEQIRRLADQLLDSTRELNLTPENVQAVVETALALDHQPPLDREILQDPHGEHPPIEAFRVPPLTGSWSKCTQGLQHPHTGQQRPIVFNHNLVRGRDDVVLAHLNHNLVTMSLRLLRAEVWANEQSDKKLYHVTARIVPDNQLNTRAMIVHARLLLLGGDNQRLHEELIAAGGYLREGRFERLNVSQVQQALSAQTHTSCHLAKGAGTLAKPV